MEDHFSDKDEYAEALFGKEGECSKNKKKYDSSDDDDEQNAEFFDEQDDGLTSEESGFDLSYEREMEDKIKVQEKRGKLPKSAVDDQFFNLAEMNAFLNEQDREEESRKGRNLGQFDNVDEMDELIKSYEEENLKSRSWALSGEVIADKRRRDELLEHYVEVDYRAAAPPTITEEKSAQLEAIIAKRIKDNSYDDVVRKLRVNEALVPAYQNKNGTIEQNVRKSLAEVYGDKYSEKLNTDFEELDGQKDDKKLDPQVSVIKQDLDALFLKLDALSHFQFRPQPISEEVKIVNNMPSLRMEEVGPNATAEPEANLLAPEEVAKHLKFAPKATEERTKTDRKRQRRQKKKKQHILASIGAMNGGEEEASRKKEMISNEGKMKKAKGNKRKLNFADQMQALVEHNSGDEKKKRKMKMKR